MKDLHELSKLLYPDVAPLIDGAAAAEGVETEAAVLRANSRKRKSPTPAPTTASYSSGSGSGSNSQGKAFMESFPTHPLYRADPLYKVYSPCLALYSFILPVGLTRWFIFPVYFERTGGGCEGANAASQ
jgi:hypothetical protein